MLVKPTDRSSCIPQVRCKQRLVLIVPLPSIWSSGVSPGHRTVISSQNKICHNEDDPGWRHLVTPSHLLAVANDGCATSVSASTLSFVYLSWRSVHGGYLNFDHKIIIIIYQIVHTTVSRNVMKLTTGIFLMASPNKISSRLVKRINSGWVNKGPNPTGSDISTTS